MIQKVVSIYVKLSGFTYFVLYVHRSWGERGAWCAVAISHPSEAMGGCSLSKGYVQIQQRGGTILGITKKNTSDKRENGP